MDFEQFQQALFSAAAAYGFADCELYYERGNSFEVRIFNGELSQYKNAFPLGLSFRGLYQGKMGYAYTEKMHEDVIPGLLKNAAENAGLIEEEVIERLFAGSEAYPEADAYNESLNLVTVEEKIEFARAMEKAAYALDKRVKSVDYCVMGSGEGEVGIANTKGLSLRHRSNFAIAYVYARVEEDGVTKLAGEVWFGNDWSGFSPEAVAAKAVERAISYLPAKSCPSGKYAILFDNITACDFMSVFSHSFYAERVQKGFSLLKDKLGQAIASEAVSIRDDGICPQSLGSVPFDSEGVACQNKLVVENGVLKTYLYNLKSAEKDGVESTGNGFKPSFRSAVDTSHTNFYITPSQTPFSQMVEEMGQGILITELQGLHAGANAISGDFSLSADGFLVEDGKITRPVEQITVAGNYYQLLKDIVAVGEDLRFDLPSGGGAVGMPSIYVRELDVSGL